MEIKKITAIVVACCFLNGVLYAPAWAVASYADTYENTAGLVLNTVKRNPDLVNTFPACAMFSRLTGEAAAHPEAFDAQAFMRACNGSGAADTVEFEKIKPFIDKIENMKSAEPEALLKEALAAIGACSARIDAENAAPSAAVLRSLLNAVKQELEDVVYNNPDALHPQAADNQTGLYRNLAEHAYWLCASAVELSAIITIYGIGTSTAVALLEFKLMVRIVLYTSEFVGSFIGVPIHITPELLQILIWLAVFGQVFGRLFGGFIVTAYYVSGLLEGRIDLFVVNWVLEFAVARAYKILFL